MMDLGWFQKSAEALLRTVQGAPLDKHSLSKSTLVLSLEPHPSDVLKPTKTTALKPSFQYTPPTDEFLTYATEQPFALIKQHNPVSTREKWLSRKRKDEKEFPAGGF